MKKLTILISILFLILGSVSAQELRCNVTVSSQKIKGANKNLFRTMQSDIYEFMNNRKWTEHVYSYDEKIKCNILIRLDEQIAADEFRGTIQVQLTRPVYNSSYETTILNIKDNDFHCRYVEYQPLEYNETSNRDNLTNILAYYAYVILGFDYDTFSPMGGTQYFEKAQAIVNNSQNAAMKGWKAFESERNRYWLVENMLNNSYQDYRNCLYQYHRQGLDLMSDRPDEGRSTIANSLRDIQKVFRRRPNTYIVQLFFDAKSDELVNIFSKSYPDERNRVMAILTEVDPANGSKYEKIAENEGF
ncbi:type IX secretion system protein PorD [Maribellus maritimus]|uniref:type IX secretion system protein PorD n=1 Tax=Maribellus maritimus TaxID=2870838 RepID=UPI001EEB7EC8|nr:DUF4835 family protein [Maribellus maritimus]MCG6188002.1 DUF4835 family protein [Maribellus maritimus]